ncbi:MAG: DNA repair exonuclease [Gemmatimonadaceae bacterium]|jgi:DNA repair exonuclease SbcCD nuclease subunit|nr:DNA repair exonuclease [Gemmatimonadaceae bacterium]
MRVAHLADLHIGFRQYVRTAPGGMNQREVDVGRAVARAIDAVLAERPDAVVVAGDVFHQVRPSNPAIVFAVQQFLKLRTGLGPDVPIVVIAGNHDLPRAAESGCILRVLRVLGITVVDAAPERVQLPALGLSILAVPDQLGAPLPRLAPDPEARWNLLCIHGEVPGLLPPDRADGERPVRELPMEELERAGWDYVALGHYHVHRQVGPTMWYAGALEYTSSNPWGELADERRLRQPGKGFVIHDLADGSHRFVPIAGDRRLLDLEPIEAGGLAPVEVDARLAARVAAVPGGIEDAVVRLRVLDIPRVVARDLDQKQLQAWKRAALHFQVDTRRPELIAVRSGSGSLTGRPSLQDLVRDKLRTRLLPGGIDRELFLSRGLEYLRALDGAVAEPTELLAPGPDGAA